MPTQVSNRSKGRHPHPLPTTVVLRIVPRALQTLSLFILIAVAMLRPLVSESYDSDTSTMTQALQAVRDPSPLRTLIFDALILLAAIGAAIAAQLGPERRYRRTGLEWGTALVAVGAVVSCFAAGNKRLAINGAIDWLCGPIAAITLVQLLTRPWRRRILLAAVLASASVQAFQCYSQNLDEFDDTWRHYESIKNEFWARQGVELASGEVALFEARMLAREASGYFTHSNIAGSHLTLCGIVAIGVLLCAIRRAMRGGSWARPVVGALAALWILGAVMLTKSRGAMTAGAVGLLVWLLAWRLRNWLDRHRRKAFGWAWALVAAVLFAMVGYGVIYDRLPGWSLTFRWQYWRTSVDLILDHWITGVGRENFGRHYLQYKPITASEEVSNPHNLFVDAAAEWGIIGLVGMVVMIVGASRMLLQTRAHSSGDDPLPESSPGGKNLASWMLSLLAVVTLGRLPLLGTNDPNYLYYHTVTAGLCWLAGFGCVAAVLFRANGRAAGSDGAIFAGTLIALFTFIIHDLINFALFVPGSATTFFALLGLAIAEKRSTGANSATSVRSGRRWLLNLGIGMAIVTFLTLGLIPVARSGALRVRAEQLEVQRPLDPSTRQRVLDLFHLAEVADPFDPTPLVEQARRLLSPPSVGELSADDRDRGIACLKEAIHRDPHQLKLRRTLTQVFQPKAEGTGAVSDFAAAVEAATEARRLYPQDPKTLVLVGDQVLAYGRATRSADSVLQAVELYSRALELDDARWEGEKFHRLTTTEKTVIRERITQAEQWLAKPIRNRL